MVNFGAFNLISYIFNTMEDQEGKVCSKCQEWQTLNDFRYREDRNLYSSICLECEKEIRHNKYAKTRNIHQEEYWMILDKPGDFHSIKEQQQVAKVMKSMGWKYNILYSIWVKKGIKEIKDGRLVWPKIKEAEQVVKKRITKKKKLSNKINSETQRTVERPPYEELLKQIKELGYRGTGKLYGVSDNAIRKWIRYYIKQND